MMANNYVLAVISLCLVYHSDFGLTADNLGNQLEPNQDPILHDVNDRNVPTDNDQSRDRMNDEPEFDNAKDVRFDSAAMEICDQALKQLHDCNVLERGKGQIIPCLIENRSNITSANCKQFLVKMSSIVFGDYRLINKLATACDSDIRQQKCGRLDTDQDSSPHSQGQTIKCLSERVRDLTEGCKHEILIIAELQADDYHMDRPLFYACRDDRER